MNKLVRLQATSSEGDIDKIREINLARLGVAAAAFVVIGDALALILTIIALRDIIRD